MLLALDVLELFALRLRLLLLVVGRGAVAVDFHLALLLCEAFREVARRVALERDLPDLFLELLDSVCVLFVFLGLDAELRLEVVGAVLVKFVFVLEVHAVDVDLLLLLPPLLSTNGESKSSIGAAARGDERGKRGFRRSGQWALG